MLEALDLPFVQRGLAEILLLSVAAGLVGTWIVLRGLAFYSHAVGTASFPGLVVADGLGFAAPLGALGAALMFAIALAVLSRGRGDDRGAEIALILVGMLAAGVILASDVFGSSAALDTLLFGSLFLVDGGDLALAAAVSLTAIAATVVAGRHWLARGFEAEGEHQDARGRALEPALLVLVALATIAALSAVGALLVAALFVVPAATTRLWTARMLSWQLATIALCAAEGAAGVLLSVELNAPPGATIAVLSGLVFAVAALGAALRGRGRGGNTLARWAATGATALLLAGCGSGDDGGLAVVATTPVAGDLAGQVAGDAAEVTTLLDPSTDPHEYEPRPDDVEALARADLVVASGGELDAWITAALSDSGSNARLLVLANEIPHPLHGDQGGHEGDGASEEHGEEPAEAEELDPHWWHDPRNAAAAVGEIATALGELEPDAAASFDERADAARERIEGLDRTVERCLHSIPAAQRKLVTDHDAFGYLAARYDIEIVGAVIPALTTEAQPSAGEIADLRETIEREGVRAVFPEAAVSTGLARAIAEETGASANYELYGDSLGPPDSEAGTYAGMLSANMEALVGGLTGGAQSCEGLGDE